eukprot:COSAG03_NODE_27784_length_251_cov_0.677632_2_plen_24_part_01
MEWQLTELVVHADPALTAPYPSVA